MNSQSVVAFTYNYRCLQRTHSAGSTSAAAAPAVAQHKLRCQLYKREREWAANCVNLLSLKLLFSHLQLAACCMQLCTTERQLPSCQVFTQLIVCFNCRRRVCGAAKVPKYSHCLSKLFGTQCNTHTHSLSSTSHALTLRERRQRKSPYQAGSEQ